MIDLDLFAGPGGWSEAARSLGIADVGIELDAAACATRSAAGHVTVRADVSRLPAEPFAGRVRGVIASPPCVVFSAAGSRGGTGVTGILADAVADALAGKLTRAARRREMAKELRAAGWPTQKPAPEWTRKRERAWKAKLLARKGNPAALRRAIAASPPGRHLTREQRSARIWTAVRSASLVIEPARFIAAADRPEWVALEQVPEVLPVWRRYADELRAMGYSVWTGILNAADYSVPQTRERAILIASRVRQVARPEPTHYDPRRGDQLWGTPWVSMAEALGWGATGRPVPTVTAGGTATGGADSLARGGREALETEREAGRWALRVDAQAHASVRAVTAPAPAPALKFGHSAAEMQWVLHTNRDQRPDGTRQTADPTTAPALTAKSGGQWVVKSFRNNNNNNNACERSIDEPAGTLFFGQRSNWAAWVTERPATTVQGDPRVGRPGHKDRDKGERQFEQDSVRITVEEAAALQSFPCGYPWQGTKTARFRQCGDAMPPLLAIPVLGVATGTKWQPVAERYAETCRLVAADLTSAEGGEAA